MSLDDHSRRERNADQIVEDLRASLVTLSATFKSPSGLELDPDTFSQPALDQLIAAQEALLEISRELQSVADELDQASQALSDFKKATGR